MINHWEVEMQTQQLKGREIKMQHAWVSRKKTKKKQIKLEKRND